MSPVVNPAEVEFVAIRAQGAGGQHVNKVSTAVHLRFDIRASSLPDDLKLKLLAWPDQRISSDGVLVIKSQGSRSQGMNREEALVRLQALIDEVAKPVKRRRPTRPTYGSQQRRLQAKGQRAQIKSGRSRVTD